MSEYLTTDEVCGTLAAGGVDEPTIGRIFAARLEPENLDDPERTFCIGVPAPENTAYLVVYKFALPPEPEGDDEPNPENLAVHAQRDPDDAWTPRWVSVEGPFALADVPEKAQELTA